MSEEEHARYALARAMAAMNGHLSDFIRGEGMPADMYGGYHEGYMSEADNIIESLKRLGHKIVKMGKNNERSRRRL